MDSNVIQLNRPPQGASVCVNCGHFRNLEPGSARQHVWYNHICKANPLPTAVDPYDGKKKPYNGNAVGNQCFNDDGQSYECCRDINNGHCPKYSPLKETL